MLNNDNLINVLPEIIEAAREACRVRDQKIAFAMEQFDIRKKAAIEEYDEEIAALYLKRCPFCGCPSIILSEKEYWIRCTNKAFCFLGCPQPRNQGFRDRADAIRHWNKRAA